MCVNDIWEECPDMEPCTFRLANGNHVKVVFAHFWIKMDLWDIIKETPVVRFYGARVYSNENTLSDRCVLQYELRAPNDFSAESAPTAYAWIAELISSRAIADFDSLEDFYVALADKLADISSWIDDAVRHYAELRIDYGDSDCCEDEEDDAAWL